MAGADFQWSGAQLTLVVLPPNLPDAYPITPVAGATQTLFKLFGMIVQVRLIPLLTSLHTKRAPTTTTHLLHSGHGSATAFCRYEKLWSISWTKNARNRAQFAHAATLRCRQYWGADGRESGAVLRVGEAPTTSGAQRETVPSRSALRCARRLSRSALTRFSTWTASSRNPRRNPRQPRRSRSCWRHPGPADQCSRGSEHKRRKGPCVAVNVRRSSAPHRIFSVRSGASGF